MKEDQNEVYIEVSRDTPESLGMNLVNLVEKWANQELVYISVTKPTEEVH